MTDKWPTKGFIETVEGDPIRVDFAYNPKEYSISKQNSWAPDGANRGMNSFKLNFGGGQPKQLKLQLFFDTYESGDDVRVAYTNKLFQMMDIQSGLPKDNTGAASKIGEPPKCKLQWGEVWTYYCVLESLSCQFTLFLASGRPVRAQCDLQLKQAFDEKRLPPTNPSSRGEGGERSVTVKPAERLDLIAYQAYGDARLWRTIALANGIPNPRAIRPGQKLVIPPLAQ